MVEGFDTGVGESVKRRRPSFRNQSDKRPKFPNSQGANFDRQIISTKRSAGVFQYVFILAVGKAEWRVEGWMKSISRGVGNDCDRLRRSQSVLECNIAAGVTIVTEQGGTEPIQGGRRTRHEIDCIARCHPVCLPGS